MKNASNLRLDKLKNKNGKLFMGSAIVCSYIVDVLCSQVGILNIRQQNRITRKQMLNHIFVYFYM